MSQINEALNHTPGIQASTPAAGVPPMLAVDPRTSRPSMNWIWPVAIVLFLLLIVALWVAISQGAHTVRTVAANPAPAPAAKPTAAPAPPAPAPSTQANPVKPTRVQGIIFVPANPYAIINGRTVHVGDTVDGLRVAAISADAVTLAGNGRTNQFHVGY